MQNLISTYSTIASRWLLNSDNHEILLDLDFIFQERQGDDLMSAFSPGKI